MPNKTKQRKTIGDYLETFEEPYRTQAIENAKKINGPRILNEKPIVDDDFGALLTAFLWHKSPEGSEYWGKFASTLDGAI